MRLLLDANLSWRVAALRRGAGVDAVHVRDFSMMTASDEAIMRLAVDEERVLASEDADFGTLLGRSGSSVPSIVLVRTGEALGNDELATLLLANLPTVADFAQFDHVDGGGRPQQRRWPPDRRTPRSPDVKPAVTLGPT